MCTGVSHTKIIYTIIVGVIEWNTRSDNFKKLYKEDSDCTRSMFDKWKILCVTITSSANRVFKICKFFPTSVPYICRIGFKTIFLN